MHAAQTQQDWAIVLTLKPVTGTSPAKTIPSEVRLIYICLLAALAVSA